LSADVVERADMRMIQVRDDFSFAFKALASRRIIRKMRRYDFDGDSSVEARV
jgi:hypothetical protein